jgi:ADP-ribose pyrophosphatase
VLSSPGVFGEVLHLFLARELTSAPLAREQGEVMEVHWMPFAQAYAWALDGTIRDAKTALGLLRTPRIVSDLI